MSTGSSRLGKHVDRLGPESSNHATVGSGSRLDYGSSRLDHTTCRQEEMYVKEHVNTFEAESLAEETLAAAETEQPKKSCAVRRKN